MNFLTKPLLLLALIINIIQIGSSQINYTQPFDGCNSDPCNNWDWSIASGNITAITATGYTPCAVADPAARANLSSSVTSGNLSSTVSLGTSSGEYANFGFSYKVINYTTGVATAANSCTFNIQWATAAAGPWTSVETFQNISSTACTPFLSSSFFPTAGAPIFMRIAMTRNSGDFWVVIDDITLVQPPASQILPTECVCNNDQTPNMLDGTFNTALRINYNPPQAMAPGLIYTLVSSTGLNNVSGGPIGNPTFTLCNGGCPPGIMNGEYYLLVQVQSGNSYSAMVDGPDADALADLTLNTTSCSITYPPLPIIPIDDIECISNNVTFASSGGTYSFEDGFPDGFSQTGTGPLMIDYATFDGENDNPYTTFLTASTGGCNTTSSKTFEVYTQPIATINNRLYDCRKVNSKINLFEMLAPGTDGNGKFYIGATEVVSGSYTVTGNICQSVTYRIEDPKCGNVESVANFQVTISPAPTFDLSSSAPSPVCMDGGSVSVSVTRTSTGSSPIWTVNGATMAGPSFSLAAPSSKGSNTYNICLTETNPTQPLCGGVTLPSGYQSCSTTTCKKYTVYNDGYGCGANNIFSSQCEEFAAIPCEATVNPTLELACGSIFSISLPFDIVTTGLDMDVSVIDCTDEEVCGHFNASLLGLEVPGGGGPQIKDLPGIGAVCSVFDFCIKIPVINKKICPLKGIYNLLQCDKSLLEIIFDAIAQVAGGDGGEWKLVADTDGDGAFDYIVTGDDLGISQGFPSSSDFCIPNNVKGSGTINVRLVAGWPNAPTDVCGKVVTDGISLLELLPLGAIPIVGPIIEDIFATLNCDIDMAWSNYADATVTVTNSSPPTFLNCNEAGYVFGQTPGCTAPVNWSVPLAISACDEHSIAYAGITDAVDVSNYVGTNVPTPVTIGGEGIYQTAGPIPGSALPPGTYTVTYTAVSCNGNPAQCTFNVTVLADIPPLACSADITLNTDAGECTAFVNGLMPLRGLGGCYSILNYSFTDPVSGTINSTSSTTPGTINTPSGHHFELGTTTITYTLLVDANNDGDFTDPGETQTCTFTVTVEDNEKPHAVCVDSEITLDNSGNFTIYADELASGIFVDGGSSDNCQDLELTISKDGTTWTETLNFDCSEEGANYIKLRAVDAAGNESTCFAIVYVNDYFSEYTLNLDVPEVCFEPFQNSVDFSPYLVIATPHGTNISHQNVGTLGPDIVGTFGISGFLPDPGSTTDPGTITEDGVYTLGTGTGWITISYVIAIGEQINQIDGDALTGCYKIVHDIFRVQKLDPVWNGGFMCCDQDLVWLGGASWDGIGDPTIPAGMISLTDIRGSYPGDVYGEWTGEGVTFQNPDGIPFSGDEFYQFDPNGLDGTYTLTYIIGDEPCAFTYSQDIRVTCQDLHVDISDYTVCPANWVEEKQVLVNLDDKDLVISTIGFDAVGAAGGHYADGTPVVDLDSVVVNDGRVVIPGFYAPAVRDQEFEICVTTFQVTPFGCADVFCYIITVQDLEAPIFNNCPKEPIIVDAPAGWCSSFVNFEYPWAQDNCMGRDAHFFQVDTTGLVSGDLDRKSVV